jgi:hypothetical protein
MIRPMRLLFSMAPIVLTVGLTAAFVQAVFLGH